jgi:16S rRNA (uracil1498-N3)-methyltransferase
VSVRLDDPGVWRLDTFRVAPGSLSGGPAVIDGQEGHHAVDVVRVREGDLVRLIDGEGTEAIARVGSTARSEATTEIIESRSRSRTDGVELTIAQSLLKGRAFDEVVRRCAELGVATIVPLATERSIGRVPAGGERSKVERWESIALAATKQSRGVFVPRVEPVSTLTEVAELAGDAERALVAWEEESGTSLRDALAGDRPRSVLLIVGPEGGLGGNEVAVLTDSGAVPVSVGERVLKADWAAAAIAAMISHELGGLRP